VALLKWESAPNGRVVSITTALARHAFDGRGNLLGGERQSVETSSGSISVSPD
jgi:hypothetical protein